MRNLLLSSCLTLLSLHCLGQPTAYTENGELASFDFESMPTSAGWRSYDLDGKSTYIYGEPKGWFWTFEDDTENGVCAATSLFNYSTDYEHFVTPTTVPADDWLFSPAVELPQSGSYLLQWDARSANEIYFEDYEVRIIDADLLDKLEASFTSSMTLREVSAIMVENSELLATVIQENPGWTTHSLSVNGFRGQKVSFIWRYTSNHSSSVYFDNYRVVSQADRSFDVTVACPQLPENYTNVPAFMAREITTLSAEICNVDSHRLNNVTAEVTITGSDGTEIYRNSLAGGSLEPGQIWSISENLDEEIAGILIEEPYTVTVSTKADNGFTDVCTACKESRTTIGEDMLAWEMSDEAAYSIGSTDTEKKLGQRFPVWHDATLQSVTFMLTDGCTVESTRAYVYEVLADGSLSLLAESHDVNVSPGTAGTYTANLATGISIRTGHTYLVALYEEPERQLSLGKSTASHGWIAVEYTSRESHWVEFGYGTTFAIALNLSEPESGITATHPDITPITHTAEGLLLRGNGPYAIVNIQGIVMETGCATGPITTVWPDVPKGMYVIQFNGHAMKFLR